MLDCPNAETHKRWCDVLQAILKERVARIVSELNISLSGDKRWIDV